jgi:hypothetical protein
MFDNIEQDEVYSFKLTSGEEVLGKVVKIRPADNYFELDHAVTIAPGAQGMQMVPAMFTALPTEKTTVNITNVVMVAKTSDDIVSAYTQAVTGIQTPSKQIITG